MVHWLPNLAAAWAWLRCQLRPPHRLVESRPALPQHAMARSLAPQPLDQRQLPMSSAPAPTPSPSPAPSSGTAGSSPSPSPSPSPASPPNYSQDSRLMPVTCAILTGLFTNAADRPAMLAKEAVETAKLVLQAIDADDANQNPTE